MNHKVKGIQQFLQTLGEFRELNRVNISTAFFDYHYNPNARLLLHWLSQNIVICQCLADQLFFICWSLKNHDVLLNLVQ